MTRHEELRVALARLEEKLDALKALCSLRCGRVESLEARVSALSKFNSKTIGALAALAFAWGVVAHFLK